MARGGADLALGPFFHGTPVGEIGKLIGKGELFEEAIFLLDLAMHLNNSTADTRAREQLVGIERLGEIFIGAGFQAAHDRCLFLHAGKNNDVGEVVAKFAANAFAEFDAAEIGHQPIGDDQAGAMLGEFFDGFLSGLGEEDGVFTLGQRAFDEFARHG